MTVCDSCNVLFDGLGDICRECEGVPCANDCGEIVLDGGFCSMECAEEYRDGCRDENVDWSQIYD